MTEEVIERPSVGIPRWLVRTIWVAHRTTYRLTRGRIGLRETTDTRWGMMRLRTVGRRTGKERIAILGYIEDGPDLVTLAMNGWADPEPAWWLNLQARPQAIGRAAGWAARGHRARRDQRREGTTLGGVGRPWKHDRRRPELHTTLPGNDDRRPGASR